ncbi:MAG: hypothetical protein CSA81_07380 [Acidobacteria bacterium]|nr:MAG: hypothetical protein CSA81_07380 [Acidobacteriota bacterium]PIE91194.1 MAG: hypothetical protein CR997_02280 [Acidobacteriota bacterium]
MEVFVRKIILCIVFSLSVFASDTGLHYVPGSVNMVGKLDVGSTLSVEGFKENILKDSDGDLSELKALGLDPTEDVEDILFGVASNDQNPDQTRLIALIRYNRRVNLAEIITAYAKKHGRVLQSQDYRDVIIYELDKQENLAVTQQIEGEWSLFGDLDLVRDSIDLFHKQGKSASRNKQLMAQCQDGLLPHLFWAVGTIKGSAQNPGFKNVLLTVDYFDGFVVGGKLPFETEEEKAGINQTLSMGTGLIMMMAQGKMNPQDIEIKEHDDYISFKIRISSELIQSLKQQAAAMDGQTGEKPVQ